VRATETREKPVNVSPATSMTDAKKNSLRRLRSFDNIIFTHGWFVSANGPSKASFPGT